jgi:hypothetical protein
MAFHSVNAWFFEAIQRNRRQPGCFLPHASGVSARFAIPRQPRIESSGCAMGLTKNLSDTADNFVIVHSELVAGTLAIEK